MDKSQIPFLSATQLAELIKAREVSAVEATGAYLERTRQLDRVLHSYITITAEQALADARQADQEISSGNYRGPMHGIPVAVKEQFNTKGIRTAGGSTILGDFIAGVAGITLYWRTSPATIPNHSEVTSWQDCTS